MSSREWIHDMRNSRVANLHDSYTRSTNPIKGKKSEILETKNEVSLEYVKTLRASDEGIYEVVSIKDKFCAFSTQKAQGKAGQKLLTYL